MTRLLENCDGRNHGQKNQKKNNKKTLKQNPEAKCMVCTWLKNERAIGKGNFGLEEQYRNAAQNMVETSKVIN